MTESLEVALLCFESRDRILVDLLPGEFGEGAIFALGGLGGELTEFIEHGPHGVGLAGRPMRRGFVSGDDLCDLFEFDDVWPVGDDPVALRVLFAHRGGEVVVHLGGVEGGVDDPVDELPLVGWRCFEELLQVVLTTEEFARRCACQRPWCCGEMVSEPDAVF